MSKTPNPLCGCGCGNEVALPWNKFIQGHANAIRLSETQRREVQRMLDDGESSYKIGRIVGRTPATVREWRWKGIPEQKPAAEIIRREDLISAMRVKLRREEKK